MGSEKKVSADGITRMQAKRMEGNDEIELVMKGTKPSHKVAEATKQISDFEMSEAISKLSKDIVMPKSTEPKTGIMEGK